MASILSWDKPKKVMTDAEYRSISACGAPPGVYESNMSDKDKLKWKAKLIGGKDPRVEIRKCLAYKGCCNVVVIVRKDRVDISLNNTAVFVGKAFDQLVQAVAEAREALS